MYPVTASIIPQSPTTPQASVASLLVASAPTPGKLPTQRVNQPLQDNRINNNKQGTPSKLPGLSDGFAESGDEEAFALDRDRLANTRISSFPTLFLAQLFGQGDPSAAEIGSSFEVFLSGGASVIEKPREIEISSLTPTFETAGNNFKPRFSGPFAKRGFSALTLPAIERGLTTIAYEKAQVRLSDLSPANTQTLLAG